MCAAAAAPFSSCGELKKNLTETKFVAQRQKRLNIIFKFLGHSKLISLEKNFNVVVFDVFGLKALKFIYSEKATKFCKISTLLLTGTT